MKMASPDGSQEGWANQKLINMTNVTIQASNNASTAQKNSQSTEPATSTVSFSIKQIASDTYRAVIPPGNWVDTGVPVIASYRVYIKDTERNDSDKFILKVGGHQYPSQPIIMDGTLGAAVYVEEGPARFSPSLNVPYDFEDTVKIKADGDHAITVFIYLNQEEADPFANDPTHMALHAPSDTWFTNMRQKLARR